MWDLFYHLHCFLLLLGFAYGHYLMFRYKKFKLCYGPQYVIGGVYFVVFIIYGMFDKKVTFTVPSYLAVNLIFLWSYLIYSKQWAQIVYQNVIIINTSWYIRQGSTEDMHTSCIVSSILLTLSTLYPLFRAIKEKEVEYLSRWNICFGIIESICLAIFGYLENETLLFASAGAKILIYFVQYKVFRQLKEIHDINESKKKHIPSDKKDDGKIKTE